MTGTDAFAAVPDVATGTLFLRGEFDVDGVEAFHRSFEALTTAGASQVTLDLSGLRFIGSAGLGCLIRASQTLPCLLRGVRPAQLRVLELTGLDQVLDSVG